MNLILFEDSEVDANGLVALDDDRGRHLRAVLGVTSGQPVRIGIIDGPPGTGVVERVDERVVVLRCTFDPPTPRPAVDLLLALPRPKVLRRLWAQLSALGVSRVMLTNAARVERNYFDTHLLDAAVYRPLLLEGLQQARDTHVPAISVHRQFRRLVEDDLQALSSADTRIVADPSSDASVLTTVTAACRRVLLAIGPEGGWNAFELELLRAHGFASVGLGPRTLRSDTACVALLALTHEVLRAHTILRAG